MEHGVRFAEPDTIVYLIFAMTALSPFICSTNVRNTLLAVWLSGNALASINVVALRQTRLVPGWVTVCGWVNHLGI